MVELWKELCKEIEGEVLDLKNEKNGGYQGSAVVDQKVDYKHVEKEACVNERKLESNVGASWPAG